MGWFHALLLLVVSSVISASCPSGTVYNADTKMCNKYGKDPLSFVDAVSECRQLNGDLASIQNAFINLEVQSTANIFFGCSGHLDYWLGGSTLFSSSWAWTDGSKWSYTNWAPGNGLSVAGSQCLSATISDGRWFNSTCDVMKSYVCAISETTPTCPSIPTQVPCTIPTVQAELPCEDGWTHLSSAGSCYKVLHDKDFWSAENNCTVLGAHLTSIHNYEENEFVREISQYGRTQACVVGSWVWIGLHLEAGQWKWTDGSPVDYQFWSKQAQSSSQCAFMIADRITCDTDPNRAGEWNCDDQCGTSQRAFVCKKKAKF